MKILINTPSIKELGGVANHFLGLKPYWNENVRYHTVWSRRCRRIKAPFYILAFIWKLIAFRPDMVLINPSMGKNALVRDFLYLKLARALGFEVSVFVHGFNLDYAKSADWKWICCNLNKASHIIVLAKQFKDLLVEHGIKADIQLSTTKVSDCMIEGFDLGRRTGKIKSLLFLSRLEKAKGVYEAIDTFVLLKQKHPELTLKMIGDGSELSAIQRYVTRQGIADVEFTGALYGQDIADAYQKADLFFFPSYGEGMPTVVLEAMAFGLPVITRYVGGLCDFFEDGKMGRITDSLDPIELANLTESMLSSSDLVREISIYNHQYAKEHFLASKVARDVENILRGNH